MRIAFRPKPGIGAKGGKAVAEADIYFNADTPMSGLRLTGITVWVDPEDGRKWITMPAKPNSPSAKTRFWDFIRAADATGPEGRAALDAFRKWVLEEYEKEGSPGLLD